MALCLSVISREVVNMLPHVGGGIGAAAAAEAQVPAGPEHTAGSMFDGLPLEVLKRILSFCSPGALTCTWAVDRAWRGCATDLLRHHLARLMSGGRYEHYDGETAEDEAD